MANQGDFVPRCDGPRRAIRLLFFVWILYFITGLVLRKTVGQPYPGFFMPSFAGIGLSRMSATEGETVVARTTVTFGDETTQEISLAALSDGVIFPNELLLQVFLPQKEAERRQLGFEGRLKLATSAFFHSSPAGDDEVLRPIQPDLEPYLESRVKSLFPQRPAQSITFQIYRESFPLIHPQSRTMESLVKQRMILFSHENSD